MPDRPGYQSPGYRTAPRKRDWNIGPNQARFTGRRLIARRFISGRSLQTISAPVIAAHLLHPPHALPEAARPAARVPELAIFGDQALRIGGKRDAQRAVLLSLHFAQHPDATPRAVAQHVGRQGVFAAN